MARLLRLLFMFAFILMSVALIPPRVQAGRLAQAAQPLLNYTNYLPLALYDSAPTTTTVKAATSYYEGTIDPTIHRRQGCTARKNAEQGIAVLNYGRPEQVGTAYGAGLIRRGEDPPPPVPIAQIELAAQAFIDGYAQPANCAQVGIPITIAPVANLVVALGTTNTYLGPKTRPALNPYLTYAHGVAWAQMVVRVQQYIGGRGYSGVSVAGAIDVERDWWFFDPTATGTTTANPQPTLDWASGYTSVYIASRDVDERRPLYNFGSMDGPIRDSSWQNDPNPNAIFEAFHTLSWAAAARPLPQLYKWPYAKDWYQLKNYTRIRKNQNMQIAGVMMGSVSSPLTWPDTDTDAFLDTNQGPVALYDALNRTLKDPYQLTDDLLTNDTWRVAPGTSVTLNAKPGCQASAATFAAYTTIAARSCVPAGTILPRDSTFSAKFLLPRGAEANFNPNTMQTLDWLTVIIDGQY